MSNDLDNIIAMLQDIAEVLTSTPAVYVVVPIGIIVLLLVARYVPAWPWMASGIGILAAGLLLVAKGVEMRTHAYAEDWLAYVILGGITALIAVVVIVYGKRLDDRRSAARAAVVERAEAVKTHPMD